MQRPMIAQDLLNADIRVLGRLAREGWRWWAAELTAMIPAALRRSRAKGVSLLAEAQSLNGPVRLWRDGAPVGILNDPDGKERCVDLALPGAAVLIQDLELPRVSQGDLRRLVELNIDRFTPFRSEQVYFDIAATGPVGEGTRQRIRLAVLERDRGRAAVALAARLGLKVQRIGVASTDLGGALQFDFSRAMREETGPDAVGRRRVWLWVACAALAGINVLVAVLEDMNDVGGVERLVAAQRPAATRVARLRQTVQLERARRLDLLTRRSIQEPLRILDAASRTLPPTVWVQRLEWNGRALRLAGYRPPAFDAAAALQGSALHNVRSLASDMVTPAASGQVPFDLLADSAAQASK